MSHPLKEDILNYLHERGADMVGVASASTWPQIGFLPKAYHPTALWPAAESVIVIGIQMPLPIVETTPSTQHMELYRTCNRILDNMAFELALWLNRKGQASIFLSRDGYARIEVLIEKPMAAFSHNFAALYAGLGNFGINHTILTKAFGPRVRFVSVFTAAELPPDPMVKKSLCIRCGACVDLCPVKAFTISKAELADKKGKVVAEYEKIACAKRSKFLTTKGCYPCGVCIKVCPVGKDRKLYGRENPLKHYREENKACSEKTKDPFYKSWTHIRDHGSFPFDD